MELLKNRLIHVYKTVDRATNGALSILQLAFENFSRSHGAESAASIAYYALFSLFPLLLVIITIGSYFIEDARVIQQIIHWITAAIPVSPEIIVRNIETVIEQRGTIGLVGFLGLLWSGTNVLSILSMKINRAFPGTEQRNFLQQRLYGFIVLAVLTMVVFLSFTLRTALYLLSVIILPLFGEINVRTSLIWTISTGFLPFLMIFLAFLFLFRLIPRTTVRWSQVFWGALVAACGWELLTRGFTWYLSSGMAQYELVYGSLGAVVALMFYIYWCGWIVLFGAHLSAAVKQHRQN